MKRSLSTKLIFVFLFLAVTFYFGVLGYNYLLNPQTSTVVYSYRTEDSLNVSGWFVRDEEIIDCDEALLEIERAEGERVAAHGLLATSYENAYALDQHRQLGMLETRLEQLRYAQTAAKDAETALKLDGDIRDSLIEVRAALSEGDCAAALAGSEKLKATVLKREYAYAGADDLSGRIHALRDQIAALSAQLSDGSKRISAPFAGTYSAVTDGYESVLTPAALRELTPSALDALAPGNGLSTVGKLIRGEKWYYVAAVPAADAALLPEGRTILLRASSGVDFDLEVTVERVSKEEDGRAVVVLRGDKYLAYVTMLRGQNAELILRSYAGLRIPTNALRVAEDGSIGVYCRIGLIAYFKPVDVIYWGDDYCLVSPVKIDSTSESRILLYTLRAGDEVIISAKDLYDGKVVG